MYGIFLSLVEDSQCGIVVTVLDYEQGDLSSNRHSAMKSLGDLGPVIPHQLSLLHTIVVRRRKYHISFSELLGRRVGYTQWDAWPLPFTF